MSKEWKVLVLGAGDMRYCGSTHEKDSKDPHKRVTRQTERRERGGGGGGGEGVY